MGDKYQEIVFGGGCFWCTEAVFKMLNGISSAIPGYSGGEKPNPTYSEVSSGNTGYVEVVKIQYDPEIITFNDLLTVFFATHNPTTINRQGNDVGTQYNSRIFYTTEYQKEESQRFINDLNSKNEGDRIVTQVLPLDKFYPAEDYHKNYFERHPNDSYCELVINPKLEKVQKDFSNLLLKK